MGITRGVVGWRLLLEYKGLGRLDCRDDDTTEVGAREHDSEDSARLMVQSEHNEVPR